ncbi:MAG TPA: Calx-beta domain-containing protein [Pyrinomonadaceae bacterium]|jgi:hypothetical protein|nr:Calx-beta domain-containing protein [Pyrinomonadaceae bacterium]
MRTKVDQPQNAGDSPHPFSLEDIDRKKLRKNKRAFALWPKKFKASYSLTLFVALLFIFVTLIIPMPLATMNETVEASNAAPARASAPQKGGTQQEAAPASGTITPLGPTVNWTGTATGTGSGGGEGTCVEGVNCDTFRLTVAPGDYTGKTVGIKITWTVPANDYDLYIHKCPSAASTIAQCNATAPVGQDGQGAPQTEENASIDPTASGSGDYTVHVVYFATSGPADQYRGTASIQQKSAGRSANYVSGGITFSPNVTVKAPAAARDGEPSSRTDVLGNHYVSGIRGFPAGVDLWYVDLQPGSPSYDPYMRNWVYRGQPDAFSPVDEADLGGDGGGDVDLAVGFPNPGTSTNNNPPTLSSSSLIAANISTQRSTDKGQTFVQNNLGNATGGIPADDRQWQEFHGKDVVYLLYRTLAPAVTQIQRSIDGGLTFGPAQTAGAIGQVGYIDVHQATGTVYISGNTGQVCHSTVTIPGTGEAAVYQCTVAATDPNGVAHIFFPVKVADDGTPNGTVYVAYSNDHDIFLVHSTDRGVTWSQPVRVSNGPETKTSVFAWMETGPTPGSVGIVWYGTPEATNNDNANWKVFYAQSFNATAATPTFRQVTASDHFIHGSNISEGGLTGTANRNLIDYFQVSFDPTGAAVIGYTDDHNDFDGHTYVMRQTSGPRINGDGKTNVPNPGPAPAAASGPYPLAATVGGEAGSQVTDFRQDVTQGLVAVVPTDDPLDIVSVRYACETGAGGLSIVATMKVSDLTTLPPGSNWRMHFTANAPFAGLSPTGDYSFALSDRGDQFFLRASTDPTASFGQFAYGTAIRGSDGAITYTTRGAATGCFDQANDTITVRIPVGDLNQFATRGPIINGSVIAGLRGSTFTSQANGKRDITRGGTEFTVGSCGAPTACTAATPTPTPTATPTPTPTPGVTPTPTPTATPTPGATPTPSPTPAPSGSTVQFDAAQYTVTEACTFVNVNVTRSAPTTGTVTVNYITRNGSAQQRGDFTLAQSRLTFADGETSKTFPVLICEDGYAEGSESATVELSNPTGGAALGAQSTATIVINDNETTDAATNPIDDAATFVCQHYHDFLNRQSDASGQAFWTNQITSCGTDPGCRDSKRQNVSQAFFLSTEFQHTGYYVIRINKTGFGDQPGNPRYARFLFDTQEIQRGIVVGQGNWEQQLEANKQKYAEEFVARPEFQALHGSQNAEQYVDSLFANAGVTPTPAERNAAIAAFGGGGNAGRAAALRSVVESGSVYNKLYNPGFVLMQYFGYLRRNPDAAPDNSFVGYNFWLTKMNEFSQPGEDVRNEEVGRRRAQRAEMVRSFIISGEYRGRFGTGGDGTRGVDPNPTQVALFDNRYRWASEEDDPLRLFFKERLGRTSDGD